MIDRPVTRIEIHKLVGIAFGIRLLVTFLTPVPSEDGVNYLWMAQRLAAGAPADALSEVFPPGMPLLLTPAVATGLDPFRVSQWMLCLLCALAIWPCVRIAERVEPRFALATGLLLALVPTSVRSVGAIFTEPVFALFAAWSLSGALGRRHAWSGLAAGMAFWIRPEALALPIANLVLGRWRGLLAVLPIMLSVVGLATWRSTHGQDFDLLPILTFNAARGDAGLDDGGLQLATIAGNLLDLVPAWVEAFWIVGGLALIGMWRLRRDRRGVAFLAVLVVALAAIVLFLTRRRFLVAWLPILALFVPAAIAALPARARFPTLFLSCLLTLLGCLRIDHGNKHDEVVVAEWLRATMRPGERVEGDLTRVLWYSGGRPLPPRHFTVAELVDRARQPGVRFVALGSKREGCAEVAARLAPDFTECGVPERERRAMERRGIMLLERRR
ncbi:MAG: glycosyltransferase family 87 protein [Planctomycetota bacterium]